MCTTYLTLSTYLLPRREGEEEGRVEKDQTITTTKTTNKRQTTSTSTSRYLLPFLRITVSVAWYIYLTVCEMYMQCRSKKKNHQSINKIIIPYPPPTCTFTNTLTLPYLALHSVLTLSIPPQQTPSHTRPSLLSFSVTISGLSPPTYLPTHLPYRTQVYLAFNVLLFLFLCLPCIIYIHTYILSFLPAQPTSRYVGTHLPYLSTFPTYQPSLAVCPPACLSYPVCCILCVGNDDDEKSTLWEVKGT